MKAKIQGYNFCDVPEKAMPIIERALQLNDVTLRELMLDANWIVPFDVTIDTNDPASIKRAKLMGIEVKAICEEP